MFLKNKHRTWHYTRIHTCIEYVYVCIDILERQNRKKEKCKLFAWSWVYKTALGKVNKSPAHKCIDNRCQKIIRAAVILCLLTFVDDQKTLTVTVMCKVLQRKRGYARDAFREQRRKNDSPRWKESQLITQNKIGKNSRGVCCCFVCNYWTFAVSLFGKTTKGSWRS